MSYYRSKLDCNITLRSGQIFLENATHLVATKGPICLNIDTETHIHCIKFILFEVYINAGDLTLVTLDFNI